ncbi:hypothetical protein [Caulobacter soli]|nr:hypothetical protein [Caulobacter soli]
MKLKPLGASRQWSRTNPELAMATGWAVVCGALWLVARMLGVA